MILDEELIAAWRRDGKANLPEVIEKLVDPAVANVIMRVSWREQREVAFRLEYAPLLTQLISRYGDSGRTFFDDLLSSVSPGGQPIALSRSETEAVCRILLDLPDLRNWRESALQILPHYREVAQDLLDQDLGSSDREKMYRATRWLADLNFPGGPKTSRQPTQTPNNQRRSGGHQTGDGTAAPDGRPTLRRSAPDDETTHPAMASCVAPPSGLVGWWSGDTDARDVFGGNNPTADNAVRFVPGEVGYGFRFDYRGGIAIPDTASLRNQQFTWMAWARPDGPGPNNDQNGSVIIKKSDGRTAAINLQWRATDNKFLFFFGNIASERIESIDSFAPGSFYLVAGTYDGSTFRLYVNGINEGLFERAKTVPYPALPWIFGSTGIGCTASCRTWNGVIDEVQAYNRALADSEILSIFQAGSAGVCRGPDADQGVRTATNAQNDRPGRETSNGKPTTADPIPAQSGASTVGSGDVYRTGNGVSDPTIILKVEPEYSEAGRLLRALGTVMLYAEIQPDGIARNIRVLRSLGYGLDEKAIEAVRKWRFSPGTKDGKAVTVTALPKVDFQMLRADGEPNTWYSGPMVFDVGAATAPPVAEGGTMPELGTGGPNESVVLDFTVTSSGSVKDVQSISGSKSSSDLLTHYLQTWRFQPAVSAGRTLEARGRVRFVKGVREDATQPPLSPPAPLSARGQEAIDQPSAGGKVGSVQRESLMRNAPESTETKCITAPLGMVGWWSGDKPMFTIRNHRKKRRSRIGAGQTRQAVAF